MSRQDSFQIIDLQNTSPQSRLPSQKKYNQQIAQAERQNPKNELILIQQKAIITENLSRLKCLLSQKKQNTRRNRMQLSPPSIQEQSGSVTQKQNFMIFSKYGTPADSTSFRFASKADSSQRLNMTHNQQLITDIKKKIGGDLSQNKNNKSPYTQKTRISPSPHKWYFYEDKQIKKDTQIKNLVSQNVKYSSLVDDKNIQLKQQKNVIKQLQDRLRQVINLNNKNEQKFHYVLSEKNEQIKKLTAQNKSQTKILMLILQNFMNQYEKAFKTINKSINTKIARLDYKLQFMDKKYLSQIKKKIKLQKMIFQNQTPYRKTKNFIQMSPTIKGDSFQDLQKKRHQMEKQVMQKQIQLEKQRIQREIELEKQRIQKQMELRKDKLQEDIIYYQLKTQALEKKILQYENAVRSLNEELEVLKQKNQELVIEKEKLEKQRQKSENNKRPAYLKKQVNHLSFLQNSNPALTPISKNIQTSSIASQVQLDSKNIYMSYIEMSKIDRSQNNDIQSKQKKPATAREPKSNFEALMEQKKQQYSQEIQHIKQMLKEVQQHTPKSNKNSQAKQEIKSEVVSQRSNKSSKTPVKLKQLSKIQTLAKKQKKQKQIILSKIQTLTRQLDYQRQKNSQLQTLVDQKQQKLFEKVKNLPIQDQQDEYTRKKTTLKMQEIQDGDIQSQIQQEDQPFQRKLSDLRKVNSLYSDGSRSFQWQSKVKQRLQNAVERLQKLEEANSQKIQ